MSLQGFAGAAGIKYGLNVRGPPKKPGAAAPRPVPSAFAAPDDDDDLDADDARAGANAQLLRQQQRQRESQKARPRALQRALPPRANPTAMSSTLPFG